ncbi:MAG: AraC family transcriptional regulator [Sneathiellales bacterium]|nr:AraC family transcriptional regulator [Sneathiellales bacterium]
MLLDYPSINDDMNWSSMAKSTSLGSGLPALWEEFSAQGIEKSSVLRSAGLLGADDKELPFASLNHQERVSLFRAANALCTQPGTGLLAGSRQKISYFGVYGYALATSATLGEAFRVGKYNFDLAAPVLRITLHFRGSVGILKSHNPRALGASLPFVAEFWRSSQQKLMSLLLGYRFPTLKMYFPYPKPKHASLYEKVFECPVHFGSDIMEWHFDASALDSPCVHADQDTAMLCHSYCDYILSSIGSHSKLQQSIQAICFNDLTTNLTAKIIAEKLGFSRRTLFRELAKEGVSLQSLIDTTKRSIAVEYLRNTDLSVEEISFRCGYQDISNFRKAFKRWTGCFPSSYRKHPLEQKGRSLLS